MEHLHSSSEEVTKQMRPEQRSDFEAQASAGYAFNARDQDNVGRREGAYADWEVQYLAGVFPEPDAAEVKEAYKRMKAEWRSMGRISPPWTLYRQALIQGVFRGSSEYEAGTQAQKVAAYRFIEEQSRL